MSFPIQSCRDGCSVGITKTSAICPGGQIADPYHVWLSEIMLQQTRVEAVKSYYARFLQALPTLQIWPKQMTGYFKSSGRDLATIPGSAISKKLHSRS